MDIIPTNTFVVLDSCENDELEDIARNCGIDLGGGILYRKIWILLNLRN